MLGGGVPQAEAAAHKAMPARSGWSGRAGGRHGARGYRKQAAACYRAIEIARSSLMRRRCARPMFIHAVQHNSELDAFRAEVRALCAREIPAQVQRKQARGQHLEKSEYDAWLKRLGARGWLTGKWPKEEGGLGWSPEQFLAFQEELGRAGAPPLVSFGPTMAGPVIYTFGTPEQKQKHLQDIIRNNKWWCPG